MAIVRVALPVAADQLFDYWSPSGLEIQRGSVLRVRLGRRRLLGIAVDRVEATDIAPERVAPVDEIVTALPPLPADLCELARFVSEYYQQPIGQCFAQLLPPLGSTARARTPLADRYRLTAGGHAALARHADTRSLLRLQSVLSAPEGATTDELHRFGAQAWRTFGVWRKQRLVEPVPEQEGIAPGSIVLNVAQKAAVIEATTPMDRFAPSLVQGITGSGKTEVYFAAVARVLAAGRQALLLVPEINLTPQLEQRIASALPDVSLAVLHSGLSSAARLSRWLAAARGDAQLIVGTRLAVYTPLPRLGLIVVDEEHDVSFKQQEGVRYHARDVAVYRAWLRDVPVILGSATPSLETYAHARRGRYRWLKLPQRAIARSVLPSVRLVPNRASDSREGLGAPLRQAVADRLARGEQTLPKGHDFPRLTLVGVLGADNALYSADFRATERLFALLEQVAGRAGRGSVPGEVIVQTDFPDHPLYTALVGHDYERFAETLLAERELLDLPPFAHLALLTAEAPGREAVTAFLERAVAQGRALVAASELRCEVYSPVPAGPARRAGLERGQALVQSAERPALHEFLPRWKALLEPTMQRRVRWTFDIDPLEFA